jgi:multimeric flavodoxin WrbA
MITFIDGSLGAPDGNTSRVLDRLEKILAPRISILRLNLQRESPTPEILQKSKAFIFASGTYWDSWGSPLQKFLEDSTELESSTVWLGKPAAVVVTMHSVGGKGVLSRLQGVLSSLGLLIPPMSGLVYSYANHRALESSNPLGLDEDLWRLDDLEIIAHNLLVALDHRGTWKSWRVHEGDPKTKWI